MIFRRKPLIDFTPPHDRYRCLLVAHQGAPTPRLCRMMEERCQRGPCEMHVLVSRFKRAELVADPALGSGKTKDDPITVDDSRWDVAEARLDSFMRALGDLGQPLTGEILAGNALRTIRRMLRVDEFDEVVVITSESRRRWPTRDLVSQIRRSTEVPVITVAADDLAA